jgi:hypothetical protein
MATSVKYRSSQWLERRWLQEVGNKLMRRMIIRKKSKKKRKRRNK